MGRKRKNLARKFGFQAGHTPVNKGKTGNFVKPEDPEPFMRLPHHVFESRVTLDSDNILTVPDIDQSACPPMLLRPRPKSPEPIDEYVDPAVTDPDNHTYKHYVPSLVSILWNATIKKHAFEKKGCDGELDFDSEAAQKWGYAWKERLRCKKCNFVGEFYKLYYE